MPHSTATWNKPSKQDVDKTRREVIKLLGSSFMERFKLAIPEAGAFAWPTGFYNRKTALQLNPPVINETTYCNIIAELSLEKPWTVTYWRVAVVRVPQGGGRFIEETSTTELTIDDLIQHHNNGGNLRSPIDKALRSPANAEHILSVLVRWFYIGQGLADITNGDVKAFAKSLRDTTKVVGGLEETEGRTQGRTLRRTPARPSATSSDGVRGDGRSRTGQNTQRTTFSASDLDESSSRRQSSDVRQHTPSPVDSHHPRGTASHGPVNHPSHNGVRSVAEEMGEESPAVDQHPTAEKLDDAQQLPSDLNTASMVDLSDESTPDPPTLPTEESFEHPPHAATGKIPLPDFTPVEGDDSQTGGNHAARYSIALEASGTENYVQIHDRLQQSILQHSEAKALLKYSKYVTKKITLARYRHEDYTPSVIRMEDDGQDLNIFACLKFIQGRPQMDMFYADNKTGGEFRKMGGVSLPKHTQKALRRPFSQTISLGVQPGEKQDGGDRLRCFCKYVFAAKGILPWDYFNDQNISDLVSVLAFMFRSEPRLHSKPSADFADEDNVARVPVSSGPVRRRYLGKEHADQKTQGLERLPPPFSPLETPPIRSPLTLFSDSGISVSASPATTSRLTSSPAIRAHMRSQLPKVATGSDRVVKRSARTSELQNTRTQVKKPKHAATPSSTQAPIRRGAHPVEPAVEVDAQSESPDITQPLYDELEMEIATFLSAQTGRVGPPSMEEPPHLEPARSHAARPAARTPKYLPSSGQIRGDLLMGQVPVVGGGPPGSRSPISIVRPRWSQSPRRGTSRSSASSTRPHELQSARTISLGHRR